jgi:hypothetical protein
MRCEFNIIMSGYYTSLEEQNEKDGDEQYCIKAPQHTFHDRRLTPFL